MMRGSVSLDKRRGTWWLRFYQDGVRKAVKVGDIKKYPTRGGAERAARLLKPAAFAAEGITINQLTERFIEERMSQRYSTRQAYLTWLNGYILPKWGAMQLEAVRAMDVEPWLLGLDLSPKSKSHIRGLMSTLFKAAIFWEYTARNPMEGVTVKGASKRQKAPRVLNLDEFTALLAYLPEPYRAMTLIAQCLGLRFSELVALKWSDVDWLGKRILVQRAMVVQREGDVKTEYSQRPMPLDDALLAVLKQWHAAAESKDNWVWASPAQGWDKPMSYTWCTKVLHEAAALSGIGKVGWHTLRHTYRSWLQFTGAAIGVQQKLMRHADIRTTMNVYGDSLAEELRSANSKVVRMVLPA